MYKITTGKNSTSTKNVKKWKTKTTSNPILESYPKQNTTSTYSKFGKLVRTCFTAFISIFLYRTALKAYFDLCFFAKK